jgi:hypothetical protein
MIKPWTLRTVVQKKMEKEILRQVQRKSGGAIPGERDYLKNYQSVLTEVVSSLEEEEREEFEKLVEVWNEAGPDVELQRK